MADQKQNAVAGNEMALEVQRLKQDAMDQLMVEYRAWMANPFTLALMEMAGVTDMQLNRNMRNMSLTGEQRSMIAAQGHVWELIKTGGVFDDLYTFRLQRKIAAIEAKRCEREAIERSGGYLGDSRGASDVSI